MNIVQKRDIFGHWVDVLHAQQGQVAIDLYQRMEKREGKDDIPTGNRYDISTRNRYDISTANRYDATILMFH